MIDFAQDSVLAALAAATVAFALPSLGCWALAIFVSSFMLGIAVDRRLLRALIRLARRRQ